MCLCWQVAGRGTQVTGLPRLPQNLPAVTKVSWIFLLSGTAYLWEPLLITSQGALEWLTSLPSASPSKSPLLLTSEAVHSDILQVWGEEV